MNQSEVQKVLEKLNDEIERVHKEIKIIHFTDWQNMNKSYELSKTIEQTAKYISSYMDKQCDTYKKTTPCNYGCKFCNCKRY